MPSTHSRHLLALLLFFLLSFGHGQAAIPVSQPEIKPLRILSWNIYMLPRFVQHTGKRNRAQAIAEELKSSEYQVLVFQEAFLSDARRIIRKHLHDVFPYEYGPANNASGFKTSSGIWILSKMPLRQLEEIKFTDCYGMVDCFARKGALLLEGEHEGQTFQILGTHLQSFGPQAVRQSQYEDMRQMLDRHQRPGVPQIVCGDMNTSKSKREDYEQMLKALDVEDGPIEIKVEGDKEICPNDMRNWGNEKFEVIDYVFYRGNAKPARDVKRNLVSIRKKWNHRHRDLSDHFAVDCAIYW